MHQKRPFSHGLLGYLGHVRHPTHQAHRGSPTPSRQRPGVDRFCRPRRGISPRGRLEEAIVTCRAGLEHHPAFLSARVTLGRALIDVGELAEAKEALEYVVSAAPENLAAIRALADIHSRQGELDEEKVYSAMTEFVAAEPGLHEVPHRPTTDAPATKPVGVAAAEPVRPPTPSDPPVVVVERGFQETPLRPTTDAPATKPVGVAAAEPVRPPTPSDPPGVSSADTDALRAWTGFSWRSSTFARSGTGPACPDAAGHARASRGAHLPRPPVPG